MRNGAVTRPVAHGSGKSPWLFGPAVDLLLGSGLAYVAVFTLFSVGGAPLRTAQPEVLLPLLSVLLSGPHYGATLLRVYERRDDRRAYLLVAAWATLLVVGIFAWSVHDAVVGTWLFTVYLTWSPWHYTAQNYGVGMMFLRRRGIEVTPLAKRLFHSSFVCSYLMTFLVIHALPNAGYNPNPFDYTSRLEMQSLGLPYGPSRLMLAGVSCVYAASALAALLLLARGGAIRALMPAACVMLTQALWFSVPFSFKFWGIQSGLDPLDHGTIAHYVFWTAIAHAIQYQLVTSYFARSSGNWRGYLPYLGKCLAAGAAIWTLPAVFFSPDLLGAPEFSAGLGILVASAVNIHHFILDGAIWKLRSSRVASVLIQSRREGSDPVVALAGGRAGRGGRHWPVKTLWALFGLLAAVRIGMVGIDYLVFPRAMRNHELRAAEWSLDLLASFGRDDSLGRAYLASSLAADGHGEAAELQYLRSMELRPRLETWSNLVRERARRRDWRAVLDGYRMGLDRYQGESSRVLAQHAMEACYALGQAHEAATVFERFVSAAGAAADGRDFAVLGDVAGSAGDAELAIRAYRESLRLEPQRRGAANNLAWLLATGRRPARSR